jgi:hypothetical protein
VRLVKLQLSSAVRRTRYIPGLTNHILRLQLRPVQVCFAVRLNYAGMSPQLDVWCFSNLIDQVLRHSARKRFTPHKNDNSVRVSGEIHRRLARRVCAPDHIHDLTLAGQRFGGATAVVDARARPAVCLCPGHPGVATAHQSRSSTRGRRFRFRPPP